MTPATNVYSCTLTAMFLSLPSLLLGQQAAPPANSTQPPPSANSLQPQQRYKRVLWFIPNYRTSPSLNPYVPVTPAEKFSIAAQDAFDPGTIVLGAFIGGISQASNSNPSFGQGTEGYFRYFGTAYGDLVIGNIMTEGVFPTLLRQDPRYFRRGTGSTWSRLGYSMGQTFWTHNDNGKTGFNYSEVFGNATAVAISNAYYPDNRTAQNNVERLGEQLALDMAGSILKEFWPDIDRKFFKNRKFFHKKNGGNGSGRP
jgi:hypothetical protein